MELATPEEKDRQKRLGGVVAEFKQARYVMKQPTTVSADTMMSSLSVEEIEASSCAGAEMAGTDRVLLEDFTYNFRQRDRIGIVGPNG